MPVLDLERMAAYLRGREDIAAAYLFGSARDGRVRTGGDVDIAVLYRTPPQPAQILQTVSELVDLTGIERIDHVTLNSAHAITAVEALRGHRLCCNDAEALATCFSLACRAYEDDMAQIERQRAWAAAARTD